MSAFLGNIHYWLYSKILLQEDMYKQLIDLSMDFNLDVSELVRQGSLSYGYPVEGNLEQIIDHGNIHGYLQQKIESVETRVAMLVGHMLDKGINVEYIKRLYRDSGSWYMKESGFESESFSGLFNHIYSHVLEGMPCDRVNKVLTQEDDRFEWETTTDIHKGYWNKFGYKPETHWVLSNAFIEGFVSSLGNGTTYTVSENGLKGLVRA